VTTRNLLTMGSNAMSQKSHGKPQTDRKGRIRKRIFGTSSVRGCPSSAARSTSTPSCDDSTGRPSSLRPPFPGSPAEIGSRQERRPKKWGSGSEKGMEKNIQRWCFDRNGFLYHGRIKALADGARNPGCILKMGTFREGREEGLEESRSGRAGFEGRVVHISRVAKVVKGGRPFLQRGRRVGDATDSRGNWEGERGSRRDPQGRAERQAVPDPLRWWMHHPPRRTGGVRGSKVITGRLPGTAHRGRGVRPWIESTGIRTS